MTNDAKYAPSRREFIQLGAAGALTTLRAGASEGHPAPERRLCSNPDAADSGWKVGDATPSSAFKEAHQTLSLNGVWSATALPLEVEGEAGYQTFTHSAGEPLAVQVPGEIHLDLMRAGRMEDPDVSDNARTRCRWPEQHSWWYRTEFTLPSGFRQNLRQRLIFEGIDLYGQIFVNGKLAGTTKNAFATHELDVKELLRDGTNELVVRVTSGMELIPQPAAVDPMRKFWIDAIKIDALHDERLWIFERRRYLRKAAYAAYGFDGNDALPNIGIWHGVRLEGRTQVVLHEVRLDTVIRDQSVSLEGEVRLENLHPWSEIPTVLELRLESPQGQPTVQRCSMGAQVGRFSVPCRIVVPNAQLWWPNGMGGQPLYRLTARVLCADQETDRQVQTLGLRTIELDRSALPQGSRFCFKVNGQRVFCKGADWVSPDLIPARIDAARCQKLVAEAKNAHFTMFRINGVQVYESDEFYDACDRAGILVWQDFQFGCALYPDRDPEFMALVRDEGESVVKRLRQHPSLALWCGNNENQLSMTCCWKSNPASPDEISGVRIYNEVLSDICHVYDPIRPYWPGSPFGGSMPNSGISGDSHSWVSSDSSPDATPSEAKLHWDLYREVADESRARFVSESYSSMAPPHLASMQQYLKPDELSRNSTGFRIHTNGFANAAAPLAAIHCFYGIDPHELTLPQFILYGQMAQAMQVGAGLEAMRFRKGDAQADCQGELLFSYNDTWGEVGWSIIDHYARRKASYYGFRRAAAPVKVLVRSREGHLVTRVVNDTLRGYRGVVRCGWVRLDGSAREWQTHSVILPANGMIEVASASLSSPGRHNPREWLYAATLAGEGIPEDQAIWLLAPPRELALAPPTISTIFSDGALVVSSPLYCHGVHLEDEGHEVLADNYFDLLPGIARRIPITTPTPTGVYPLSAILPIE